MFASIRRWLKRVLPEHMLPNVVAASFLQKLQRRDYIQAGPFTGMKFSWEEWDNNFNQQIPKFLGSYEKELTRVMEKIVRTNPTVIIDVGAADGYYAIGLAYRCANAKVVAFEELEGGRRALKRNAQLNSLDQRIEIQGRCDNVNFNELLAQNEDSSIFAFIDVEGFENQLLSETTIKHLTRVTVLVECHDCYIPGTTETLCERFRQTHKITKIQSRIPGVNDSRVVPHWLRFYCRHNVIGWFGERGFAMNWLLFEPNL